MKELLSIAALLCLVALSSCQENKRSKNHPDQKLPLESGVYHLPEDSPVHQKLELLEAKPRDYSFEFHSTGTVRAITGSLAEVAVPFSGRVTKTHARLGQPVAKGDPLFELSSPEFYEATKSFFQSRQQFAQAELKLKRQQDLLANGVGVKKELEEVQTEFEIATQEFELEKARMQVFNADLSGLFVGQSLRVVSPVQGEVVKNDLVLGQYLKEDATPLVVVADIRKVWVVATVKEKYFGTIKPNDRVEVYTDAYPGKVTWGHIHHIGDILDEETRSLQVLVECDNPGKELKPGMFASVHFLSAPRPSLLIPASAVLQSEEGSFVYVRTAKETYQKRPVKVESAMQDTLRVTEGIREGEIIVSRGGIYLNS